MSLVFINAWWMMFNVLLALIGVVVGWIMIKTRNKILCFIFGIIWFLFIPNTIYMVTDLQHLLPDIAIVTPFVRPLIALQYILLAFIGIILFVLGLYPLELILSKLAIRKRKIITYSIITCMSVLISFAVVLGRVFRIHSWDIVTDSPLVINSAVATINSPSLLLFIFTFGAINSLLYIAIRKPMLKFLLRLNQLGSIKTDR